MSQMTEYILRIYGTQKNCAEALGVNRKTVYRWLNENSTPMLKYTEQIVRTADTTRLELIGEILFNEDEKP